MSRARSMSRTQRGWILALLHAALALSVAGKFLYDRETLPRQWMRVLPYDPVLPLRGRYVRLGVEIEENGVTQRRNLAFFIPDGIPDPSRRPPNEELWVEVSMPKNGLPRPVRLGVKRDGGEIVPLDLQ